MYNPPKMRLKMGYTNRDHDDKPVRIWGPLFSNNAKIRFWQSGNVDLEVETQFYFELWSISSWFQVYQCPTSQWTSSLQLCYLGFNIPKAGIQLPRWWWLTWIRFASSLPPIWSKCQAPCNCWGSYSPLCFFSTCDESYWLLRNILHEPCDHMEQPWQNGLTSVRRCYLDFRATYRESETTYEPGRLIAISNKACGKS